MKLLYKHSTILFLLVIVAFSSYGQEIQDRKYKTDTLLKKEDPGRLRWRIYKLKEEACLQQYELRVLKELAKVDSLSYGNDSLITLFRSLTGKPLMRVTQNYRTLQNIRGDSIIVYYNKNGLIEYQEIWRDGYRQKLPYSSDSVWVKTKLTCRRYEYDDQNRVIYYVVSYPTPITFANTYTYDSSGVETRISKKISQIDFWGEIDKIRP